MSSIITLLKWRKKIILLTKIKYTAFVRKRKLMIVHSFLFLYLWKKNSNNKQNQKWNKSSRSTKMRTMTYAGIINESAVCWTHLHTFKFTWMHHLADFNSKIESNIKTILMITLKYYKLINSSICSLLNQCWVCKWMCCVNSLFSCECLRYTHTH